MARAYLPASIFTEGGTLNWTLGPSPTTWAAAAGDAPPSSTAGLLPALGYLAGADDGDTVVSPGGTATLTLGPEHVGRGQRIRLAASAQSGSGIVIAPASGTLTVDSEVKATRSVEVKVPSGLADGQYTVTFARTTRAVCLPGFGGGYRRRLTFTVPGRTWSVSLHPDRRSG